MSQEVDIHERPAHISVYVWEKSKIRAAKYLKRAYSAFPKASEADIKKRCATYLKIDLKETVSK